jgi:hypothetical protein
VRQCRLRSALTAACLIATGCGSGDRTAARTTSAIKPVTQETTYFVTEAVRGNSDGAGENPETLVLLSVRADSVSLISRCASIDIAVKFTNGPAKTETMKAGPAEANPCVAGLPTALTVFDVLRSSPAVTRNEGEQRMTSAVGNIVVTLEADDQSATFANLTGTWVLDSLIDSSGQPVNLSAVPRRPTLTFGPSGLLRSVPDLGVDGQLACNNLVVEQARIAVHRLWLFGQRITAAACEDARNTIDAALSRLLMQLSIEFVSQGNTLVLGSGAARFSRVRP